MFCGLGGEECTRYRKKKRKKKEKKQKKEKRKKKQRKKKKKKLIVAESGLVGMKRYLKTCNQVKYSLNETVFLRQTFGAVFRS